MTTILRSSFIRSQVIEVPSGHVDVRPPKMIVGISLSLIGESTFPEGVITMPAILDTGFNRTLEIDEWHLVHWAGLHKGHLKSLEENKSQDGRKYDLRGANLWLHRAPYTGSRTSRKQIAHSPAIQPPSAAS